MIDWHDFVPVETIEFTKEDEELAYVIQLFLQVFHNIYNKTSFSYCNFVVFEFLGWRHRLTRAR